MKKSFFFLVRVLNEKMKRCFKLKIFVKFSRVGFKRPFPILFWPDSRSSSSPLNNIFVILNTDNPKQIW